MKNIIFNAAPATDTAALKELWNRFTPRKTIYDDWDFRHGFYHYLPYELFLHTATSQDEVVGFLLLQKNTTLGYLEFFGGSYMEDNRTLVRPGFEAVIPGLYATVTSPARLESIVGDDSFTTTLPLGDYKYTLSLTDIRNPEDYFQKYLEAESRGKMRRKIRKVENETVLVEKNNFTDLDLLIEYNQANFGEHSSFNDRPHFTEIIRDLVASSRPIHLLTFTINDRKEGVSLAVMYNGVYEYFNLGVNPACPWRDLTTFVNITNLKVAIASGAHTFDAFTGDYGWKEHWRLQKTPQHVFIKP